MKSFLITVVIFLIAASVIVKAQNPNVEIIKKFKSELIAVDSLFNARCQTVGFSKAFIEFSSDDVILMRRNQLPIIGKKALIEKYSKLTANIRLTWTPLMSDVAISGELGYTFGRWESREKISSGDTVSNGVYVSIWKRQKDNSWKYVFDGGNETPVALPWNLK